MTHEPIYERVLSDLEQDAHRAGHWATAHLPHHARHATSTPAPPSATIGTTTHNPTPEENVSLTTNARRILSDGMTNIKGWAADIESDLPAALDEIDKIEADPLYQAVKGLSGGRYAGMALNMLTELGTMAEQDLAAIPSASTAGASQPAAPAEPDAATVADVAAAADSRQPTVVQVPVAGAPVGG
jgi:hypothetical protein